MSVNGDMRAYKVQRNVPVRTASGAQKDNWVDSGILPVAVYRKDDRAVYGSEIYKESTHTGLTYGHTLGVRDHRLVRDGAIYRILSCNPQGRLTQLLLKVIENG